MQHPDVIANDVFHALKRLARLKIGGAIDDDESVTKKADARKGRKCESRDEEGTDSGRDRAQRGQSEDRQAARIAPSQPSAIRRHA